RSCTLKTELDPPKRPEQPMQKVADRADAANFVADLSLRCSTLLAHVRVQRRRTVSRHTLIQLDALERLAAAAHPVQRQGQLTHHADQRRLGSAAPLRLLPQIPSPHRLLPNPTQCRQVQPTPHHAGATLADLEL